MRSLLFLGALLGVFACGGMPDVEPSELDAVRSGHDANQTQQQTLGLADELFDFDPTLDPTGTAQENADAIYARTTTRLPCAMVMASGTTVTVSASTPCSGPNGVTFLGSVTAGVSKSGSSLTVALTFTNVTLGDATVNGSVSLVTSNGTTFDVTYALTKNGTMVSGSLTVVGATNQMTINGSLTQASLSASFDAVVWKKGDCYPSSGSLTVTQGRVSTTYTFTSSTPSTGTVTLARNRTAQLPAYGSCPHASDAGP